MLNRGIAPLGLSAGRFPDFLREVVLMIRRGFTLVELLVVILVIGILVGIAIPGYNHVKDKAREVEVKNNLHGIQLALERYATDNYGVYPPWLYGGDFSDSWTLSQEAWDKLTDGDGIDIGGQMATSTPGWVEVAEPGDGDALLEGGYLETYPRNPFTSKNSPDRISGPARNPIAQRSDGSTSNRDTGGAQNNLMWEISGGPPKNQGALPTNHPGWKYLFPVLRHDPDTNEYDPNGPGDREHSMALVGNFYYYSLNRNNASWGDYNPFNVDTNVDPSLQEPPIWVDGYILVAYGARGNKGWDVYDPYGEFADHYRTADAGGFSPVNTGPGGPDGLADGAIMVLSTSRDVERSEPTG